MKFNIKKTFVLKYKKLFVIAGNFESDDLTSRRKVINKEMGIDKPIASIEIVNVSNEESFIGLTISFATREELFLLKTLKEGDYVFVE